MAEATRLEGRYSVDPVLSVTEMNQEWSKITYSSQILDDISSRVLLCVSARAIWVLGRTRKANGQQGWIQSAIWPVYQLADVGLT